MKILKRLACLVMVAGLVTFLWTPSGMATLLTETETFSGVGTPDLEFNKFDTSLGTLNSIKLTFSLTSSGGYIVMDNDSDSPLSGDAYFGGKGTVSSEDVNMMDSGFLQIFSTNTAITSAEGFTAGAHNTDGGETVKTIFDSDPASLDTYQLIGGTITDVDSGFVASAVWGQYSADGGGTFTVTPDITSYTYVDASPSPQISTDPQALSGYFAVTYDYTPTGGEPVPEPGTMLLLGIGLAGLAGVSRKRMGHK